jgi:3',5'-cyclic AMP phosphodiesterase CpdA
MRTIAHLSDLHFGRLDARVVQPLLAAIRAASPDLIAISGDLTQRARRNQFADARTFLQSLEHPYLVVPGNHDVPLYDVARRFLRPLARYKKFIAADLEPSHVDDEIAVIGLNSARSLTFGRGRLNQRQIGRAAERLRTLDPGVIKIIVTHHPFDLPDDYGAEHLVGSAKSAMAQFAEAGADLFLAGHLHVSHIGRTAERYKIAGHSALVVQAGTISARLRGEPNSFNVLRVKRPDITVTRHAWDEGAQAFAASPSRSFRHTDDGWTESKPPPPAPGPQRLKRRS